MSLITVMSAYFGIISINTVRKKYDRWLLAQKVTVSPGERLKEKMFDTCSNNLNKKPENALSLHRDILKNTLLFTLEHEEGLNRNQLVITDTCLKTNI